MYNVVCQRVLSCNHLSVHLKVKKFLQQKDVYHLVLVIPRTKTLIIYPYYKHLKPFVTWIGITISLMSHPPIMYLEKKRIEWKSIKIRR
jgi:hypothetical protein